MTSAFYFYLSISSKNNVTNKCQLSKLDLSCLFRLKQSKELDRERALANEQLTRAILRERISSEEDRTKAKRLVSPKRAWKRPRGHR